MAEQYGAVTIADLLALNPHLEGNTTPENVTVHLPCQSEQGRCRQALPKRPALRPVPALQAMVQSSGGQSQGPHLRLNSCSLASPAGLQLLLAIRCVCHNPERPPAAQGPPRAGTL